jgi:hypothetical protein
MTIPIVGTGGSFNSQYYYNEAPQYILTPENLLEMRHSMVVERMNEIHQMNPAIELSEAGQSVEGRSIQMFSFGRGKIKLLLWSQMHGDEPIATAALLAIFNFFAQNFDSPLVQQLYRQLQIHALVMLNPDGAERLQRRNSQGIDVNRDARKLQTAEGQILKRMKDEIRPDFGFNLHEMRGRETVGESGKILTIALMAPPFNAANDNSPARNRAKKLTVIINNALEPLIKGHIARYKADYMPRAFGDIFQNCGISTILLESGLPSNEDPQQLLRLDFVSFLAAFCAISDRSVDEVDEQAYEQIPLEGMELFDLLIKNVWIVNGRRIPPFRADIGINIELRWENDRIITKSIIEDVGDLSITSGRKVLEGKGLLVTPGFIVKVDSDERPEDLLKKGITTPVFPSADELSENIKSLPAQGVLSFENLSSYTREPAKTLRLTGKGVIDKEMIADLLIFQWGNSDTISLQQLKYVIKNGQVVRIIQ